MKKKRHCLLVLLACLPVGIAKAEVAGPELVEKAAKDWLQIRMEVSRMETEWSSQKCLLESGLGALSARTGQLKQQLEAEKTSFAKDDAALSQLELRNTHLQDGLKLYAEACQETTNELVVLRPFLPPRLSHALEYLYRSLSSPNLSLEERSQMVVNILNRCQDFNRTITCSEEILRVEGSSESKVHEVAYWGLSHAYALDRKSAKACLGRPGPKGWQWTPLPAADEAVARLLSMAQGKTDPSFIEVPLVTTVNEGRKN